MTIIPRFKFLLFPILLLWVVFICYFWFNNQDDSVNIIFRQINFKLDDLLNRYKSTGDLNDIINRLKINTNKSSVSEFTSLHDPISEMLLRRVKLNLRELLFYLNSKTNIDEIKERLFSLISDVELINEHDENELWRKNELMKLERIIHKRILLLQNPKQCNTDKTLTCNLNKGCGFGCQIHHVSYCLILAYSTKRRLILQTSMWRFGSGAWKFFFKPLSENCGEHSEAKVDWGASNMDNEQHLRVPIIDVLTSRPNFLPQAIPLDIYSRLSLVHSDPFAWFMGQIVKYILRMSDDMDSKLESANYSNIPKLGPIVGIHIRRSDKIGSEAQFHFLSEYMKHVDEYFVKEEIKANLKIRLRNLAEMKTPFDYKPVKLKRQVVLATDEPAIFEEIEKKYSNYSVIGYLSNSKLASTSSRFKQDGLRSIIIDTMLLSQTSFLVCTFSSQVCRLAYELMQTRVTTSASGDNGHQFRSLDDVYYFGGQQELQMVTIQEFFSNGLKVPTGTILKLKGNHWNGNSLGVYFDQSLSFPTYKAQFIHIVRPMGNYTLP